MRPQPIEPQPGQESVWDYPRPPRLEPVSKPLSASKGNVFPIIDWFWLLVIGYLFLF